MEPSIYGARRRTVMCPTHPRSAAKLDSHSEAMLSSRVQSICSGNPVDFQSIEVSGRFEGKPVRAGANLCSPTRRERAILRWWLPELRPALAVGAG